MAIIIPVLLFLAAEPLAPPRHTHSHSLTHTHAHAAHAPPRSRPPVWERRRRSASSSPGRPAHAPIHMHEGDSRRREQRRGMARAGDGRYRREEAVAAAMEAAAGPRLPRLREAARSGRPEPPSLGKRRSAGASSATWSRRSRAEAAPALPQRRSRLRAFPAPPLAEGTRGSCPHGSRCPVLLASSALVEGRRKHFGGHFLRCETFPLSAAGGGRLPFSPFGGRGGAGRGRCRSGGAP
ncbi:serine/arginine repetitive matrix protein 3-like [Passer montanus]|uniref:serine/arginine repetitive matrix protein 3-like n=1 Tax=Passer montanus TaxID=9160 RepID=UPI00195F89C6|nr:serine/arginine repetitive matrix protein 3-like [Passer montanus]